MALLLALAEFLLSGATVAPHAGQAVRAIPDYPTSCLVKSADDPEPHRVTIAYDVDENGRVRNERVDATTDSCFDRTAIRTVRGWRLEGAARAGVETTFTFVLEDAPRVYAKDASEDTGPSPLLTATHYPAACSTEGGAQSATVLVDLTADGYVRNPRIKASTNACVDEVAIAKARATRFVPPGYDGATPGARGVELALSFDPNAPRAARAVDVSPPAFPARCVAGKRGPDEVMVRLDVTNLGLAENVRLVGSTNSCLNAAVLARAASWRFRPYLISDPSARRKEIDIVVVMALDDGGLPSEFNRRRDVEEILKDARAATAGRFHGEALNLLSALERDEAEGLRRAELASIYAIRASARLAAGDKTRALDDFRAASALGVDADEIAALEKELAPVR